MAAIIAWNTVYLMDAITTLRAKDIPDELLPHLAPLGWRHINLLGRYEFHGPSYSLSQRRPLRTEAAGELDVPLDDEPETEPVHSSDSGTLILGRRTMAEAKKHSRKPGKGALFNPF